MFAVETICHRQQAARALVLVGWNPLVPGRSADKPITTASCCWRPASSCGLPWARKTLGCHALDLGRVLRQGGRRTGSGVVPGLSGSGELAAHRHDARRPAPLGHDALGTVLARPSHARPSTGSLWAPRPTICAAPFAIRLQGVGPVRSRMGTIGFQVMDGHARSMCCTALAGWAVFGDFVCRA